MKEKILFLFLLVFLFSCASSPEEEGDKAYQAGEFQKAYGYYQTALEKNPDSYPLLLKKAVALEKSGQLDRALAAYSELIRKFPKKPLPRLYRARLLFRMRDEVTALKDVDRLLTRYQLTRPLKILTLALEGEIHYRQEDLKKAEESFREALALAERDPAFKSTHHYRNLLYNTAHLSFALGNFDQALETFQKYLQKKRLNSLSLTQEDYYFYTLILKYTGNFQEAEKYEAKLSPEYRQRLQEEFYGK